MSGFLGLVGTLGAGVLGYSGAQRANKMNYKIAQKQMKFQHGENTRSMDFQQRSAREQMAHQTSSVREQMAHQTSSVREQMAFQERMSNTAYQRAMLDMKQAGLNPILAFNQGGSSSPIGASSSGASSSGASAGGASSSGASAQMVNELSGAINSALETRRANAEIKNLDQQNKLLKAQTKLTEHSAIGQGYENTLLSNKIPGSDVEVQIDKTEYGKIMRFLQRLNPLNVFKGFKK